MADSNLPASELRRRYGPNGTLRDDQLPASQLRARHGIVSNSKDFSTSHNASTAMTITVLAIAAVLVFGLGFILFKESHSDHKQ